MKAWVTSVKDRFQQIPGGQKQIDGRVINQLTDTVRAPAEGAGADGNQTSLAQMPKGLQAQSGRCSDG